MLRPGPGGQQWPRESTGGTEREEPFAKRVLDFLEAWGMEGLQESLEVMHIMTPDEFASELNAHLGERLSP